LIQQSKPKELLVNKSKNQGYLKYSGLAFQIVVTILLLVYLGGKLDAYVGNETPWFTLFGSVLGVIGSMVYLIVKVTKSK
jgi:F0F1-type ATP synthase assembly protein I